MAKLTKCYAAYSERFMRSNYRGSMKVQEGSNYRGFMNVQEGSLAESQKDRYRGTSGAKEGFSSIGRFIKK